VMGSRAPWVRVLGGMILVALLVLLGGLLMKMNSDFDWSKSPNALFSVTIRVPLTSRNLMFRRLEKLAGDQNFQVHITRVDNIREEFGVDLWSKDVAIAGDNISDLTVFKFGVYSAAGNTAVDQFIGQVQTAVEEIQGVTFAAARQVD
jgi:hypothetical protein